MIKLLSSFCNLWLAPTMWGIQDFTPCFCYDFNKIAYTRRFQTSAMTSTQSQLLQQSNNCYNKSNTEKLIYTSALAQCLRQ
ncbi:hypothetical protein BYT27DRAFT_7199554 [Phlegmacium glaucopus]|nr:hypothetical protein BYT27DRAFT_7199554 [Phlegmacium glaucopus]